MRIWAKSEIFAKRIGGNRPKLTEQGIGKLEHCDRHLTNHEWREMRIEAQRVKFRGDGFPKGRKTDRIEDGNDQCGGRRVGKTKTTTAASAVGILNVSRRSNARALGSGRSIFGKWEPFRGFQSKRGEYEGEDSEGKSDSEGQESDGKRDTKGKDPKGGFQMERLERERSQWIKRFRQRRGYGRGDRCV